MSVHSTRFLLLEDDPVSARVIQITLGSSAAVTHVSTIQAAKQICPYDKIDILLCDYALPDGTVLDFLDFLDQNKIDKPVIVLSKYNHSQSIYKCWQKGAFYFIEKPVTRPQIHFATEMALKAAKPYRQNSFFTSKFNDLDINTVLGEKNMLETLGGHLELVFEVMRLAMEEIILCQSALQTLVVCDDHSQSKNLRFYLHRCESIFRTIYASECQSTLQALVEALDRNETLTFGDLEQFNDAVARVVQRIQRFLAKNQALSAQ